MDVLLLPFLKNLRVTKIFVLPSLRKILRRYLAASVVFFLCFVCPLVNKISFRSLRKKSIGGVVLFLFYRLGIAVPISLPFLGMTPCVDGDPGLL